jgi:hypothetical protein
MFDVRSNSVKQLWYNLNQTISLKGRKSCSSNISQLKNSNNQTLTEAKAISNELNQFFSTIGEKLVEDLIRNNEISRSPQFYCNKVSKNSMFCNPVDKSELAKLIDRLQDKKAPGPDNISNKLVKQAASVLLDPLIHIYNLSFCTGIVPDKLKIAKVIPVFKKGDSSLCGNYRPISLLSVFNKLLEKLMFIRLYKYLETNNILYQYQFGFRPKHSTCLALIDVVDGIYEQLDQRSNVCGMYLDVQKAFDSVSHDILLDKMFMYGVRGVVHNWFKSYLLRRQQYVFVNNVCSDVRSIKYGVPQGSVLGPLLFLLYVNDIGNALPEAKIKLFADDTNIFIFSDNIEMLNQKAQNCIVQLHQWFTVNKLTLNLSKTCFMVFPKVTNQDEFEIIVNNVKLENVNSCKYLGITLDNELKWSAHIETVYKKIMKFIGIFYKIRNNLPPEVLKSIYYAFVHPHILYGVELYANTYASYLDKLAKINNKILRILQNKPRLTAVSELYVTYNTLPIDVLHRQQLLLLAHKILHHPDTLPEIFRNYFTLRQDVHIHNTRYKENVYLPCSKLSFGEKCLKNKAGVEWNLLPPPLKGLMSINTFKYKIHNYLMSLL